MPDVERREARAGVVAGRAGGRGDSRWSALFPLAWTFWESLHLHELRMPWLGRPFIGLGNYRRAAARSRASGPRSATPALFAVVSVSLELLLGLLLALAMNRAFRGRGLVRAAVLVPWAMPTVVAALLWRFMFEAQGGIANALLVDVGCARSADGLVHPDRGRLGAGDARRRLEDDAVRGAAAARRTAEYRSRRCTKRRASTAPAAGGSSGTSRCRCSSPRSSSRSSSGRSTPSACSI